MSRVLRTAALILLACAIGAAATWAVLRPPSKQLAEGPLVIDRIREVARLETLDVALHEVVQFQPASEATGTLSVLWDMAKPEFLTDKGTAVVFATGRVGFDASKLDRHHVRVQGDQVDIVLPPLETVIELHPSETIVLKSNLDSQQTMQLMSVAKIRFEQKMLKNAVIKDRARASSERAIRALLITLGYQNVNFVESLPPPMNPG